MAARRQPWTHRLRRLRLRNGSCLIRYPLERRHPKYSENVISSSAFRALVCMRQRDKDRFGFYEPGTCASVRDGSRSSLPACGTAPLGVALAKGSSVCPFLAKGSSHVGPWTTSMDQALPLPRVAVYLQSMLGSPKYYTTGGDGFSMRKDQPMALLTSGAATACRPDQGCSVPAECRCRAK